MTFTSQQPSDVKLILEVMEVVHLELGSIRFLEIGTFGGSTAQGIRDWCASVDCALDYWGMDNRAQIHSESPFPSATFIVGDSAENFHRVPFGFDIILCDACHCFNHVVLDTLHYGERVRVGGFMLFHDTNPAIQHTMKDPHGPSIPEFHNSVLLAHRIMRFPFPNWELFKEVFDEGAKFGGVQAYRKTS